MGSNPGRCKGVFSGYTSVLCFKSSSPEYRPEPEPEPEQEPETLPD